MLKDMDVGKIIFLEKIKATRSSFDCIFSKDSSDKCSSINY